MSLPIETWNQILTAVLGLLIAVVICTANALVLLAIYKKAILRSITNYFLAALAVGDLFVGLVALPLWISRSLLGITDEEHPVSRWVDSVYIMSVATSTYNLCALSLERYFGVIFPLRYSSIVTKRRCQIVVVSVWFASSCIASLRFVISEDAFWITAISAIFVLPGIVISYCYFHIFRESSRQMRFMERHHQRPRSRSFVAKIQNRKAAITIAIIIAIFYLTSLPALGFSLTEIITSEYATCEQIKSYEAWGTWVLFLAYINAALNPWIYAVRKREFRMALKMVMFRPNQVSSPDTESTSS